MPIEILHINGRNPNLDYEKFDEDAKRILGVKCQDCKIFIVNNFPVAVTNTSEPELLILIAIEDKARNYFIIKEKDETEKFHKYLHSAIIPIVFNHEFEEESLEVDDLGNLIFGEMELDFYSEVQGLRKGVSLYLEKRCGIDEMKPRIFPQVFIKNPIRHVLDGIVIDSEFRFENIVNFLRFHPQEYINSYRPWCEQYRFDGMGNDINRILEQASLDGKEGFITLGKIKRIGKVNEHTNQIFYHIGQNLIIVKGKAGSGKSTELLSLTLKVISEDKNVLFLTFNKLLVFELSRVVNSYKNSHRDSNKFKSATINTLHQYFYWLSTKLGVKHILTAARIKEVTEKLKFRCRKLYDFLKNVDKNTSLKVLKEKIQNAKGSDLSIGEKELGVDFVNYLTRNRASKNQSFNQEISGFFHFKKEQLDRIETDKIFLRDYYGILQNVLDVLQKPDDFYDKYALYENEKLEVFRRPANVSEKHIELNNEGEEFISKSSFLRLIKKKKSGFKWNRVLIIDEAQDCHRLEKEILLTIFGEKYAIVANGGKEQLIRHNELCNWTRFNGRSINVFEYTKRKSFRMKSAVAGLCNFLAKKFNVDLNLEIDTSIDVGELVFDFRGQVNLDGFREEMNTLSEKGKVHGCSNYESLMFLTNPGELDSNNKFTESALIDEYGNIKTSSTLEHEEGQISTILKSGTNLQIWRGTQDDKEQEGLPYANNTRLIFYESCRGLEAWTVVCERLDIFFERKFEHPEAENFLVGEEKGLHMQDMFLLSNEDRKAMFAATWVLMALTRAMDTLYITCDPTTKIGELLKEYSRIEPSFVRVIKN